jgi:hypothetical protein
VRKLHITSDGTVHGTLITDAGTGEKITNITKLRLVLEGGKLPRLNVQVAPGGFGFDMQVDAKVVVPARRRRRPKGARR